MQGVLVNHEAKVVNGKRTCSVKTRPTVKVHKKGLMLKAACCGLWAIIFTCAIAFQRMCSWAGWFSAGA